MLLEPEQISLLCTLVEVSKSLPRSKREKFILIEASNESFLKHWSLPDWSLDVYKGDIEILARNGLLNLSVNRQGSYVFDLLPEAYQYYDEFKRSAQKPIARVEDDIRKYLQDPTFERRFPLAIGRWMDAERRLWAADSSKELTAIGLNCREAIQCFVDALLEQYPVKQVDPDKSHTVGRLRAILKSRADKLGSTVAPFLEALLAYFGTLDDLVHRQVHGAIKDGEQLNWPDAQRLVFQCAVVMFEIDRTLTLLSREGTA
jgi:hypothetical protein